jgi:hypothetical protein
MNNKTLEQSFNNYISKVEKELGYKITKVQRKMFMCCFVAGAESSIKISDHINIINSINTIVKCKKGDFESFNK